MAPRFSIAIPVYNRADYLQQAVMSCLAQTVDDFEVIISDDCSTEDLRSVVESFCDPRVNYFRSDVRLGAVKNHQRATSLSRGIYVTNLNSDDMLLPHFLEVMGNELDVRSAAAATYCSATFLNGTMIGGCQLVPKIRFADNATYLKNPWLEKYFNVAPCCFLFRKSAFERIGGYRISLRFCYDWDLFMRFMTIAGGVAFIPEVLAIYRKHDQQMAIRDGLYDVLELWKLDEYSHWPEWEIANLVIGNITASIQSGRGIFDLLGNIHRRGATWRIVKGSGKAMCKRLSRRMGYREPQTESHFEPPNNVESAVHAANKLVNQSQ